MYVFRGVYGSSAIIVVSWLALKLSTKNRWKDMIKRRKLRTGLAVTGAG